MLREVMSATMRPVLCRPLASPTNGILTTPLKAGFGVSRTLPSMIWAAQSGVPATLTSRATPAGT